jgi:hypothetical protein
MLPELQRAANGFVSLLRRVPISIEFHVVGLNLRVAATHCIV